MQLTPEFSSVPTSCKSPKLNNATQALCLACQRAGRNRQRCLATTAWVFHRAGQEPAQRCVSNSVNRIFTAGLCQLHRPAACAMPLV